MLTKTRRDATRPFPHNATKRFKFLLPCFYLYFYGNSLKYLLRHKHARYYAYKCVCTGVCACACLSLRGCTTRAQNSLTKNSSVLHFNDLILHKLISQRFLSQTCVCVCTIYILTCVCVCALSGFLRQAS